MRLDLPLIVHPTPSTDSPIIMANFTLDDIQDSNFDATTLAKLIRLTFHRTSHFSIERVLIRAARGNGAETLEIYVRSTLSMHTLTRRMHRFAEAVSLAEQIDDSLTLREAEELIERLARCSQSQELALWLWTGMIQMAKALKRDLESYVDALEVKEIRATLRLLYTKIAAMERHFPSLVPV